MEFKAKERFPKFLYRLWTDQNKIWVEDYEIVNGLRNTCFNIFLKLRKTGARMLMFHKKRAKH